MKVIIHIKYSNYLFARAKLVRKEEDAKSKRAVEVAAEKARDATTYIGNQFSDGQQVRLAMVAINKVINELNYKETYENQLGNKTGACEHDDQRRL